ncbi:MAG: glycoside hydrolase family 127 protein, partial [Bacteroidaceae bacterium]|nr:glycoside hydrolase family 127 protein [Bacteroidaceae bacterium]
MKRTAIAIALTLTVAFASAQDKLYHNTFNLNQVELLEGPFKHAMDLNVKVLLEYDTDRLLAPFLHEAGLPKKAEYFPNWAGLDGHVGGHYVSALAIHYAATGNKECYDRLVYMIDELERCQIANGDGYIGGV